MSRMSIFMYSLIAFFSASGIAAEYQTPSQPLKEVVEQKKKVSTRLSNNRQWLAILTPESHTDIENLARKELKLAGLRLSPNRLTPSRIKAKYLSIELVNLDNDSVKRDTILTPADLTVTKVQFSPDSRFISYIGISNHGADLYLYEIATRQSFKLSKSRINASLGLKYQWLHNSQGIATSIAIDSEHSPQTPQLHGPNISITQGKKAPRRTYQDLLKNAQDEAQFSQLTTSQLSIIMLDGQVIKIGKPAINIGFSLSPDDKYVLVKRIKPPFSHMVKYRDFAQSVEMFHSSGEKLTTLAELESGEFRPSGSDSVRKGPRLIHWRSDKPNTLAYVEALDGGDSNKKAQYRDQLRQISAPFNLAPKALVKTPWRIANVQWGEERLALITERNSKNKQMRVSFLDTESGSDNSVSGNSVPEQSTAMRLWYQKALRDSYSDPGRLYKHTRPSGLGHLFAVDNQSVLHYGLGASPEGYQPFLRMTKVPLKDEGADTYLDKRVGKEAVSQAASTRTTTNSTTLWRSASNKLESVRYLLNRKPLRLIINRQSSDTPSHLVLLDVQAGTERVLQPKTAEITAFKGVSRQLVTYTRDDGLPLSGNLYLPAGYTKKDGQLPVLMWAYPREYKNAEVASQVNYSPNQYNYISAKGPVPFVANGFAVFDRVAMPIVGEGKEKPNDNFRSQLIANAKAAIDTLVEMGVADRDKVAIGGHSYGAFMVANLLAHSDLFAAGIARSGAYNRTLTPFGFQNEKRNFWEAPSLYQQISPFTHADKIDEPLLLMHGEMDANSGTYPMQSARLFKAIRGLGGNARLVTFPFESHSYQAKESLMHMLWEQENWLDQHLRIKSKTKNKDETALDTRVSFH
ncbi:peptidase S9, prolyl oligopeptidase active site domain protein [Shewanella sediminis HAW-EB3]|uniref:Peptidase S9, prolyl oligopeptidase active site domain protein n=1 Tax=Shewanella sediminis (strain HAW-EB3) TaxID=425104 RepID=A8FS87_SHESH|nr:prolyl oligopeptidase family serine peptidase [Shewanella sediminis]ABV35710.1 peptidase S9, prolyl oligopeptidase active site domain protein [Shewanella sediminis HAW-EB3]